MPLQETPRWIKVADSATKVVTLSTCGAAPAMCATWSRSAPMPFIFLRAVHLLTDQVKNRLVSWSRYHVFLVMWHVLFSTSIAAGQQRHDMLAIRTVTNFQLKHRAFNLIHSLLRKSSSSILVVW
jgi:hypothetical protein